ncbi:hypothetical protein [Nocardia testacea]|uniref:hypothetical protein n=1 Tax=Nocardia testacea TaxID=248551 RepID=UPI0033EE0852
MVKKTAGCGSTRSRLGSRPELPELKDLVDIAWMRIDWAREYFADERYADAMERFGHLSAIRSEASGINSSTNG